jgi:hypothetical protein
MTLGTRGSSTNDARTKPTSPNLTLAHRASGTYEICPVCFWEDDASQNEDPDYPGGANRPSLREARDKFAKFGAIEERFTEDLLSPRPNECPTN